MRQMAPKTECRWVFRLHWADLSLPRVSGGVSPPPGTDLPVNSASPISQKDDDNLSRKQQSLSFDVWSNMGILVD